MKLTLEKFWLDDMIFGEDTGIRGTTLTVNREEIIKIIKEDKRIAKVHIDIVKPGESVRLYSVRDVIEPRVKVSGAGELFPGLLGGADPVGEGVTKAFKNVAVVPLGEVAGVKEGIIDMSGPGAAYTPFSKMKNLVLDCEPISGLETQRYEEALRLAGLKIARYIGKSCEKVRTQDKTVYETLPIEAQGHKYPDLPKVGYVYMLQSQGLRHDTYVYGVDAKEITPRLMYPTEVMDGAIVSSNCVIASDKNTSYHHLNNPIIEDLYERHGKDLNFCGVIITNQNVTLEDKDQASNKTAELVEQLGLNGVIISKEEYGNTDTDLMMNCRKIEEKGIKTVLVTDEYAGRDGTSQSLADADPKADAVVSTGNANETIMLAPMDKVIGKIDSSDQAEEGMEQDRNIEVEIQSIIGATNELGFNKMGTR
ncbi:glycine/sarcosine/betaine reductase component B subunit [Isachenkonia alkalipeptolytica]|uniref:Beta-aspartyl-peptidase n=1 Tax=Isachenkonia alkalipeptolytica TaxID=2565777 RepID=A0AA43XL51_9CLOT|nr:glycine/sarcosine/betaine reductase component B subunit [Isachenkonia alkalipeptolytica]NBG87875.1 beta-aspartyl-peptidase [Isachenkonia alkalipeptolytica]